MNSHIVRFDDELCRLLSFVATVASAIRMNSAYNSRSANSPHVAHDVMWLSDSLHNLGILADAIRAANPATIDFACDGLISSYERYMTDSTGKNSKATFDRNLDRLNLNEGLDIFRAIRDKANSGILENIPQ